MVGEVLKADVQKEDDAAHPVALWDSWFYISWKADRVDTDTQGFLPSNQRVYETYTQFIMVGMGCGIIIILLEVASTKLSMV